MQPQPCYVKGIGPADCGYCVHGPKETTPSVRGYQDVIASVRVVNMRDQINLACRLQGPQTPQILHKLYLHVLWFPRWKL